MRALIVTDKPSTLLLSYLWGGILYIDQMVLIHVEATVNT